MTGKVVAVAADAGPAHVTECTLIPETISRRGSVPQAIRVSFSIVKDTAADVARFTATAPAGALLGFTAHGLFARGVTIADRVLQADPSAPTQSLAPGTDCMLTYVHFVDGSSWTAPR